jgi:hypothetical protein
MFGFYIKYLAAQILIIAIPPHDKITPFRAPIANLLIRETPQNAPIMPFPGNRKIEGYFKN